jgi:VWFA-related protein
VRCCGIRHVLEVTVRAPVLATFLGVLALQAGSHGQTPAPTASQPTFRAGTTVVEVSAIVTRDGRPVSDLRPDEITVLDNGVPQPLVAFEFVDLDPVQGPAQRRDFVIVIDTLHIDPTRTPQSIDTALALIDRLGTHDRLAVAATGIPEEPLDFTTDREAARHFIRQLRGQQPPPRATVAGELELRARLAMERLAAVALDLRADAERRSILFISEGHPTLGRNADAQRGANSGYLEYLDVIRQAALSNVAIYTIDPRGLRAPGGAGAVSRQMPSSAGNGDGMSLFAEGASTWSDDVTGSLAVLALNTGGIQTRWTNDLSANLSRMVQDSRQYYRLAYAQPDPPRGKKQPTSRTIKVRVSRGDTEVRARQRYAPVSASASSGGSR